VISPINILVKYANVLDKRVSQTSEWVKNPSPYNISI
jgi:hypothetical protein